MNRKTFLALLARDAHVARRNLAPLILQTFLQPLLFVFIFGRVMVGSGYMPAAYKSLLLPGIMAMSMVFTGIWAVAMPLIAEFQFTREIEDRLLAPIDISWVAIEKIIAGLIQALVAGLMVIPLAWIILRPGLELHIENPLLFAALLVSRRFLRLWRPCAWLQRESAAYWLDVQYGDDADDIFRLYLLSVERASQIPDSGEARAY